MACRNKTSDWMNRDLIAATLKCERRLSYSREGHCTRAFAASHIKNLCWSLSKRTRCVMAAPLHTTLPYSITDLTWALKAHKRAVWLKRTRRGHVVYVCVCMCADSCMHVVLTHCHVLDIHPKLWRQLHSSTRQQALLSRVGSWSLGNKLSSELTWHRRPLMSMHD